MNEKEAGCHLFAPLDFKGEVAEDDDLASFLMLF